MIRKSILAITCASTLTLTGCMQGMTVTQTDATTGQEEYKSSVKGAGIGALAGALAGAAAGGGDKVLKGALLGTLMGGATGHYLDVKEAKLRNALRGTGVTVTRFNDYIQLNMPGHLTFDTASSSIRPQLYRPLNGLVVIMNEYPETQIVVEGHTDNVGSEQSNYQLAYERANKIRTYIVAQGVESNRIDAVGIGEGNPIADNSTEVGRQQNRRIEVYVR